MTAATVRDADADRDAAACAGIYAPHVENSATSFESVAPDRAEMAARIERIGGSHAWLVAEVQGEVSAFAYACPHRERPAYRWAVEVSAYVAEGRRRQGLGHLLYATLFDRLRERGFHIACAGITLPNEASVALHEGLGFEPVGVYRGIGWKQGAWRDVGWWQLQLGPAVPPSTIGDHA